MARAIHSNGKIAIKLDSPKDRLTSISQAVVQDVFHLSEDVDAIRERPVECIFVRVSKETPDEMAREFIALIWYSWEVITSQTPLPRYCVVDT